MIDPSEWTPEIATEIAYMNNIRILTDTHWKAINIIREYNGKYGLPMKKMLLIKKLGITSEEFDTMFSIRTANKIAGVRQPSGCCL